MIKVETSAIHGYGVFAQRRISEGETVLRSVFLDVTGVSNKGISDYMFSIPGARQVIPLDRGAIINHSDTPNVRWHLEEDKIVFVATKSIEQGEELFHNYGFCRFKKG